MHAFDFDAGAWAALLMMSVPPIAIGLSVLGGIAARLHRLRTLERIRLERIALIRSGRWDVYGGGAE